MAWRLERVYTLEEVGRVGVQAADAHMMEGAGDVAEIRVGLHI